MVPAPPLSPHIDRPRLSFASAGLFALLAIFAPTVEPSAQPTAYEPVDSVNLLGGNVAKGKWIETTGHFWLSSEGAFFNVAQPSARPMMRVDIANIASDTVHELEAKCGSPDQFRGGCTATVRGQTALLGDRLGIIASDIVPKPR